MKLPKITAKNAIVAGLLVAAGVYLWRASRSSCSDCCAGCAGAPGTPFQKSTTQPTATEGTQELRAKQSPELRAAPTMGLVKIPSLGAEAVAAFAKIREIVQA